MWISSRRARASAPLLLVVGAALASLVGCIPTDPCLRNSDCTHGERCIEGACAVPPVEQPAGDAATDTADAAADSNATDSADADETETDGALDDTLDADESG
jgi:hypothetical protein